MHGGGGKWAGGGVLPRLAGALVFVAAPGACAGGRGIRAIAPDMRGYGGTDAPALGEYTMKTLCADMAGLLDALGIEQAAFVGHDWAARSSGKWVCHRSG
ncbi:MAG: alpha/beta fold hydrolase [Dehalococcoidia bacterium]|nr:alpha/beta fold hydrolase [Dehalococcoidia bacterium]